MRVAALLGLIAAIGQAQSLPFGGIPAPAAVGYAYQRTWTAGDTTQIPSAQTNFTFHLCANMSGCQTLTGFNLHVSSSNGYDIVPSSTPCTGGAAPTILPFVMARPYDPISGAFDLLVKKSSLTALDTVYTCYGNAAVNSLQGGAPSSAFDANTAAYYVMEDASGTSVSDVSGHGNTMTSVRNMTAVSTTGQIGLAVANSSSNPDYVTLASDPANTKIYGATATYEFWFKPTSVSTQQGIMQSADTSNSGGPEFTVQNNAGMVRFHSGSNFHDIGTVTINTWNHFVVSLLASTGGNAHCSVWLNGTAILDLGNPDLCASEAVAGGYFSGVTSKLWLGSGYPAFGDVVFDDFAIYLNRQTSNDWVTARYKNALSPSTFGTFGSEVIN